MAETFARGGVVPREEAAELFAQSGSDDYVVSLEFAEELVLLSNKGHKADPHQVAAVMVRLLEALNG